jgi:hypothetical protein
MGTAETAAMLAIEHFIYAGILAGVFAFVSVVYLLGMWRVAGRLGRWKGLIVHTLYLLWQSNIAFVAVVCLIVGVHNIGLAGESMSGWKFAPLMVPGAIVLYTAILILSVAFAWLHGRDSIPRPHKEMQ